MLGFRTTAQYISLFNIYILVSELLHIYHILIVDNLHATCSITAELLIRYQIYYLEYTHKKSLPAQYVYHH